MRLSAARLLAITTLTLLPAVPTPAGAWLGAITRTTCPVGGEAFTYMETGSQSVWGMRPDGRAFGSGPFPATLPVCPTSRLPMYRDFTPEEVARLPALMDTPEFRVMRIADTPYYMAAWLEARLAPGSEEEAELLLRASWETDDNPNRKARYQEAFIAAARAMKPRPDDIEWVLIQIRAANALRELGRFDEATRALRAVPKAALGDPSLTEAQRRGWREHLATLEGLMVRRDAASEPLDAIPPAMAAHRCRQAKETGAPRDPLCRTPKIAAEIARLGP